MMLTLVHQKANTDSASSNLLHQKATTTLMQSTNVLHQQTAIRQIKRKPTSNERQKQTGNERLKIKEFDEETISLLPPLPSYLQQILKVYCNLHFFKQQMDESVQHCEEQWEQLLFSTCIDVVNGEEGIIELCKEVRPELGHKLQEMHLLMNDMITVENECLNLLEDAEDGLASVIKKSNWYKSNPQEFKRFLRKYSANQQQQLQQLYKSNHTVMMKTNILECRKIKEEKENNVKYVLQQGAFSLDHRSSRLQHVFSILSELKTDENNKELFNKNVTLTSNAATRWQQVKQHQTKHPLARKASPPKPSDDLEKLLTRIQQLHQQHGNVLKKIQALKMN